MAAVVVAAAVIAVAVMSRGGWPAQRFGWRFKRDLQASVVCGQATFWQPRTLWQNQRATIVRHVRKTSVLTKVIRQHDSRFGRDDVSAPASSPDPDNLGHGNSQAIFTAPLNHRIKPSFDRDSRQGNREPSPRWGADRRRDDKALTKMALGATRW